MKRYSSVVRMAMGAIAATSLCLGASLNVASAQTNQISTAGTTTWNTAPAPGLPYGAGEVLKLYQQGIKKDVIVNYINNSALPYHLSADQIIHLQSLGMPEDITQAMIARDGQLQQMAKQQYYPQQQAPPGMVSPYSAAGTQPPVTVVTPTSPAPDVTVIGSGYPSYYDYGYPYDYGYWPPVIVGGGWGWPGSMAS